MRILTFSTLFPNSRRPSHGVFVENRLRHLVGTQSVEAKVVAPVPWFPSAHPIFGGYAEHAGAPGAEERFGIAVEHPRYPLLPKVGMTLAPFSMAWAARPTVRRLIADGFDFDLIDAHFFYPDGVAAVMLARMFARPVVITARGTDINLYPKYALPRRMILWAAARADAMVTVCEALRSTLIGLGAPAHRVTTLRNGVDLDLFRPAERDDDRRRLGLDRSTLLSVGHLIPRKGHDLVIRALPALEQWVLLIVGEGPERGRLEKLAAQHGVEDRVRFVGTIPQSELPVYYRAADALVLASSREGWANVLLESMACGTPVVASDVWGTPEVVNTRDAGVLMSERSPGGIADAVRRLMADYPDRAATRGHAERFDWDATSRGQVSLFEDVLQGAARVQVGAA